MTPAGIITAIQTALKNSSFLDYVDDLQILQGVRSDVVAFPCIIIEPINDRLIEQTFQYEQRILSVNVTAYIQTYDKEKQIVGDATTKGVCDLDNDIRKVISADITLGLQEVYDTQITAVAHDFERYPIRGFGINLEVHYRQNRITRA